MEQTFINCPTIQFALLEIYLSHLQKTKVNLEKKMNRLIFGLFVVSFVGCGSHSAVKKDDAGAGGAAPTASVAVSAVPSVVAADTAAPAVTASASAAAAPTASAVAK